VKFPLPAGHKFAVNPWSIQVHDGSETLHDEKCLRLWQRQYALTWDRSQPITGRFDGPTQRAVVAVQRKMGLTITAELDQATWDATFEGPESHVEPRTEPEVTPVQVEAPRGGSEAQGRTERLPGASGDDNHSELAELTVSEVPSWFKPVKGGRLGPASRGPAVRQVRQLLGMQSRDSWSYDVTQRVRGLQRAYGLPVTGFVDAPTAQLLDSLPPKG
jgi:hypothetical protein